jgi:hypothetical protein
MQIDEIIKLVSNTKLYALEPGSEVEVSIYVPKQCHEKINGEIYTQKLVNITSKAIFLGIKNKDNEYDSLKNCIETCDKDNVDVFDIHLLIQHLEFSISGQREYFAWPDMITYDEVELFFSDGCRNNTSDFKMIIK